jgi:hypothetical protein
MGVAFIPELFDIYLRLGKDYQLPVLLPRTIADYTSVLELGDHTLDRYEDAVKDMEHLGWPLVDHFRMTPGVPTEQARSAYYELIGSLPGGLTYVALHPTRPGEIESIVPPRAHYRTDEYRLLQEPNFLEFVHHQKITTIGFRKIRDRLRGTVSPLS